jgi:hypothetical protein
MDKELIEEITHDIDIHVDSKLFHLDEILEIIEELYFDEDFPLHG